MEENYTQPSNFSFCRKSIRDIRKDMERTRERNVQSYRGNVMQFRDSYLFKSEQLPMKFSR